MTWTDTGDVVLFGNPRSLLSRFIQWGDGSDVSHVGVVIRDPPWLGGDAAGAYLLESGYEDFPDVEDHEYKFGVRLSKLDDVVDAYRAAGGRVRLRKLETDVAWTDEQLRAIHSDVHNRPYDASPSTWVRDFCNVRGGEGDADRFDCSALVSYVYRGLGLLSPDANWTLVTPTAYLRTELLPLNPGVALGECIEL